MFKKVIYTFILIGVTGSLISQKVTVKDDDDNVLMEVIDEGKTGSILLLPDIEPAATKNKIYNLDGHLFWSGQQIGSENIGGGWRQSGSKIYPITLTDKVGIGTSSPGARLHVMQELSEFALRVDDILNDTSPFIIDDIGNIGVGTSSPQEKVHVVGDLRLEESAVSNPVLKYYIDDTYAGFLGILGGDMVLNHRRDGPLKIRTNNSDRMTIDGAGNVGIGTITPSQKLEIAGKLKIGDDMVTESEGVIRFNGTSDEFEGYNGSAWLSFGGGGKWLSNSNKIYYNLGNVGIGNDNPGFPLEVTRTNAGNNINPVAKFNSIGANSSASIRLENSLNNYWTIGTTQGTDNAFAVNYNNNISLSTDLFRITPDGKVGIGTTSPQSTLHVQGEDVEKTGYFTNAGTTGFAYAVHGASGGVDANTNIGVYGQGTGDTTNIGVTGFSDGGKTNYGGYFSAMSLDTNYAVYATVTTGDVKYAGYFEDGDVIVENGNLGVGNITPSEKLDVDGRMKVGDDPSATMVMPGTIRYNNTTNDFEGYNGEWVSLTGINRTGVYGTVVNPVTGKVWLDRNLGATQVATSSTDVNSYGDLYQWGRAAEGHQVRTSSTVPNLADSWIADNGSNLWDSNFIVIADNWLLTGETHMWSGTAGENNPCPSGFRVPTNAEWNQERLTWSSNDAAGAFASPLKLPLAGVRLYNGDLIQVGSRGHYWSSTASLNTVQALSLEFDSSNAEIINKDRIIGKCIRCIKD